MVSTYKINHSSKKGTLLLNRILRRHIYTQVDDLAHQTQPTDQLKEVLDSKIFLVFVVYLMGITQAYFSVIEAYFPVSCKILEDCYYNTRWSLLSLHINMLLTLWNTNLPKELPKLWVANLRSLCGLLLLSANLAIELKFYGRTV